MSSENLSDYVEVSYASSLEHVAVQARCGEADMHQWEARGVHQREVDSRIEEALSYRCRRCWLWLEKR